MNKDKIIDSLMNDMTSNSLPDNGVKRVLEIIQIPLFTEEQKASISKFMGAPKGFVGNNGRAIIKSLKK